MGVIMTESTSKIKHLAEIERKTHNFSQLQSIDLDTLYERNQIHLLEKPMGEEISGVFIKDEDNYLVIINTNKSVGHQNFTKAHEFYHYKFDPNLSSKICTTGKFDKTDISEFHADLFAENFLMPEDGIYQILEQYYSQNKTNSVDLGALLYLESIFEVSRRAMIRRLKTLNIITHAEANNFYREKIRKAALHYGFQDSIYRPTQNTALKSTHKFLVEKALENEKISEKKYFDFLEIPEKLGISPSLEGEEFND